MPLASYDWRYGLTCRIEPKRDCGYTLVELMTVIVIVGVLVSIAIASFTVVTDRAQAAACYGNQRILIDASIAYHAEFEVRPPTLADLVDYIHSPERYDVCPSDQTVSFVWNPATGDISCPLHP